MKIIFAATPEFAIPAFKALLQSSQQIIAVYTKPDRPAGRGLKLTASPVKKIAEAQNLLLFQPETLRDESAQQQMALLSADVLINVAYGVLLPKAILNIPRLGCINIHPSLLPRWRGAAPIQRALLEGDAITGVTIMRMDEGLDTGDIFKQAQIPIERDDTSATLLTKSADLGAELLLDVLQELQNGSAKSVPQDNNLATYAAKITKEEAQLNWTLDAVQLDRMVRAFNPWPIAYCEIDGKHIRVWQSQPIDCKTDSLPGTIIQASGEGIDIACGKGILRLEKIQLPGGHVLHVKDILNAHKQLFAAGKKFN